VTIRPKTADRYGRTVAEIISGVTINLAQVEDGMACPLRGPAATPSGSIWASATPESISMLISGLPAAAEEQGDRQERLSRFLVAVAIAAVRSAPLHARRSC
jgi:hypothetical protein